MNTDPLDIERGRDLLADARSVIILTGAGISAESGIPTFRGEEGLWRNFRAEELATPEAFARDPRLVWEWYDLRRQKVLECAPNAAHDRIAEWLTRNEGVVLATQNVDGLHERAWLDVGQVDGGRLLEIHGTLFRVRCTACGRESPHREPVDSSSPDTLPHCEACGGLLRPAVVWFGEALDPAIIGGAFEAAEGADVCVVVGTSAVVQPAASLATVTRETGGRIIEINPESTPLTPICDVSLRGTAVACVPALLSDI